MRECSGAVILAFERIWVAEGVERRGSERERVLEGAALATVWNHMEGAMAWMLGRPLLVIAAGPVEGGGLLSGGPEWVVQRVPVEASAVEDRVFLDTFEAWRRRVDEFHGARGPHQADLQGLSLGNVLRSMTWNQRGRLIAGMGTGLVAAAAAAAALISAVSS